LYLSMYTVVQDILQVLDTTQVQDTLEQIIGGG
jgi:hypothetical protein